MQVRYIIENINNSNKTRGIYNSDNIGETISTLVTFFQIEEGWFVGTSYKKQYFNDNCDMYGISKIDELMQELQSYEKEFNDFDSGSVGLYSSNGVYICLKWGR